MIKMVIVLGMVLLLAGCMPAKEKEEGHSPVIVTAGMRSLQRIVMGKI